MIKLKAIEERGLSAICLCNTETNDLVPVTDYHERKEKAKQEAIEKLSSLLLTVHAL